jgi:hypothetical protein
MKLPQIARVMLLACVLLMGGLSTQAQDADAAGYRLVYGVAENEFNAPSYLNAVDLDGKESLFSDQSLYVGPYFTRQVIFFSPDSTKVAIQVSGGDLIVLNGLGEVIAEYDFPGYPDYWNIWGWRSLDAIVVSHIVDDYIQFYEVNLTENAPHLYPLEYLNNFFNWPITSIRRWNANQPYRDLFSFSPNFRYALTAPIELVENCCQLSEETMLVWDVEKGEIIDKIDKAAPFWLGAFSPVWSPSGERVIFDVYPSVSNVVPAYLYDFQSSPELLPGVESWQLHWSPTSTKLAYKETYDSSSTNLVIWNIETGEKTILKVEGYFFPKYWSPDEQYIANMISDPETNVNIIKVVDTQTGEIVMQYESRENSKLLGWIATP